MGFGSGRKHNLWGNADVRSVSSSGLFEPYLITSAKEAVFVVNTDSKTVNCEIGGLIQPQKTIWVDYPVQLR